MDIQMAFNIALGLVAFLGGYLLHDIRDNIARLADADATMAVKLQAIEVLVAGSYVRREDLDKVWEELRNQLQRIERKLDQKVDK